MYYNPVCYCFSEYRYTWHVQNFATSNFSRQSKTIRFMTDSYCFGAKGQAGKLINLFAVTKVQCLLALELHSVSFAIAALRATKHNAMNKQTTLGRRLSLFCCWAAQRTTMADCRCMGEYWDIKRWWVLRQRGCHIYVTYVPVHVILQCAHSWNKKWTNKNNGVTAECGPTLCWRA